MKITRSLVCGLVLLLCLLPRPYMAQQKTELDQLWAKIEELEKVDQQGMSPLMLEFHEKAMLKQYMELSTYLDREIQNAAAARERIQAGTDAVSSIDQRLSNLSKQRLQVAGRITILRTLLGSTEEIAGLNTRAAAERRPTTDSGQGVRNRQTATSMNAVGESASAAVTVSVPTDARPTTAATVAASTDAGPIQPCGPSPIYANPPEILSDMAAGIAEEVIRSNNPDQVDQSGSQMVLYTVLDAASSRSSELIHSLKAFQYIGETARTDKQLGASADSNGAVSAIEKPGFAQLLGFAIEHGGITKENDGTNLTLSTSLYSLYAAGTKDTAENYARAGILNRVGLAATFALDDKDNELANARRNNLSEWSAKVRLFGDRSSRSAGFQKKLEEIKAKVRGRLRSLGEPMDALTSSNPAYTALEDAALVTLSDEVRARMACPDYTAADNAQKQQILADVILGRLQTSVYGPVRRNEFALNANDLNRIEQEFLPNIKVALDAYVQADSDLKKLFADLQKGPLLTFAYTNHRIPTGSDYSETKFLFEQDKGLFAPLKLSTNVGMSFYNRPDRSLNQNRTRDFFAALSFGGTSNSPFTEAENKSKITYSFVGRYQRLFENRGVRGRTADIGALQFITEIPIFKGLSLPFSVTYSSATEEEKKQGFRFNFGTRLDMDKLFDLLRANSKL